MSDKTTDPYLSQSQGVDIESEFIEDVDEFDLFNQYKNQLTKATRPPAPIKSDLPKRQNLRHTEQEVKAVIQMRYGSQDPNSTPVMSYQQIAAQLAKPLMSVYNIIKQFKQRGEYIDLRENFNCGKATYKHNDFVLDGKLLQKLREFLLARNMPGAVWEMMSNKEQCDKLNRMTNQFHVTPNFVQTIKDLVQKQIQEGKIVVKQPVEVKAEDQSSKKSERPIPKCFLCPLTKQIMKDPVMISSGNTFERDALVDHFKSNGNFDPLTNETITENFMESNLYLKSSIDKYIADNPFVLQISETPETQAENEPPMLLKANRKVQARDYSTVSRKRWVARVEKRLERYGLYLKDQILHFVPQKQLETLQQCHEDELSRIVEHYNNQPKR